MPALHKIGKQGVDTAVGSLGLLSKTCFWVCKHEYTWMHCTENNYVCISYRISTKCVKKTDFADDTGNNKREDFNDPLGGKCTNNNTPRHLLKVSY